MDKANTIMLLFLVVMVVAAALFYTNTGENHRSISIGLCELKCQNITSGPSYNGSSFCAAQNMSFGYSCAITTHANSSLCNGNPQTVYVNNNCQLVSVG